MHVEIQHAQRLHFMLHTVMVVYKQFLGADFEYADHDAIATVSITAQHDYHLTLNR